MVRESYGQFCPVAMAAEILCSRWTVLLVRELVSGSTRFNEIRRGLPRMSPALLSKRLRDLEEAGIVRRTASSGEPGLVQYHLTQAGLDLRPVIETIGFWGQRWVETEASLKNLDPDLLMWDMRRNLEPAPLPRRRSVIEFIYSDQPANRRTYWLVVQPEAEIDVCSVDPGFDVDLYVATDLRTMTMIWMGLTPLREALAARKLSLTGDRALAGSVEAWLGLSPFAAEKKRATA
ncbi:winged helix-turn-helix transcriptional regulator [Propylenella binzhouense]|uniref:Transcriptional regulator n=1 Tax=Propylenella binzhouense TaxID=2555902 RepID=A0A964T2S5_9HYPH|nr:helix-turn-helix domain-containing protein [Propylenella binzhouense]MYZ47310.1 transcriptional regulator [Propylenella binzhouense]